MTIVIRCVFLVGVRLVVFLSHVDPFLERVVRWIPSYAQRMLPTSAAELRRGDDLTYRFARTGVYPFVCTYHPGMVGAVVVGGAGAPMTATAGAANGVVRVSPERPTEAVAVADPIPAASSSVTEASRQLAPWVVTGLVMATILAVGVSMRSRRGRGAVARV